VDRRQADGTLVIVEFLRTGERRYAVRVQRDGEAPIEMNPAPGYDPLVPPDLLHLVVESELALASGIFGQLAKGGHAATFHRPDAAPGRDAARARRRTAKRGDKLLRAGVVESAASERATFLSLHAWLARSTDVELRARAARMAPEAAHVRSTQPAAEREALNDAMFDRICARLDDLASRWSRLAIGESLLVPWPDGTHNRRKRTRSRP
jgi:hypothetical protein